MAYVSSTQDPILGGFLLAAYTTGYIAPLIIAASATVKFNYKCVLGKLCVLGCFV